MLPLDYFHRGLLEMVFHYDLRWFFTSRIERLSDDSDSVRLLDVLNNLFPGCPEYV